VSLQLPFVSTKDFIYYCRKEYVPLISIRLDIVLFPNKLEFRYFYAPQYLVFNPLLLSHECVVRAITSSNLVRPNLIDSAVSLFLFCEAKR